MQIAHISLNSSAHSAVGERIGLNHIMKQPSRSRGTINEHAPARNFHAGRQYFSNFHVINIAVSFEPSLVNRGAWNSIDCVVDEIKLRHLNPLSFGRFIKIFNGSDIIESRRYFSNRHFSTGYVMRVRMFFILQGALILKHTGRYNKIESKPCRSLIIATFGKFPFTTCTLKFWHTHLNFMKTKI